MIVFVDKNNYFQFDNFMGRFEWVPFHVIESLLVQNYVITEGVSLGISTFESKAVTDC